MRKIAIALVIVFVGLTSTIAVGGTHTAVAPAVLAAEPQHYVVPQTQTGAPALDVPVVEAASPAPTPAPTPAPAQVSAVAQSLAPAPTPSPAPALAPTPASVPVVPAVRPTRLPVPVTPDMPLIDATRATAGVVTINFAGEVRGRLEVRKGEQRLLYNLFPGQAHFPLQFGDGQYTLTVFEHLSGSRYRAVARNTIDVTKDSPYAVFLASIQLVNWDSESLAVQRAQQLTAHLTTDRARLEAVWRYLVTNIDYDTPKLSRLTPTYLPDIDETLISRAGICYDYASLLAAMMRSLGVPTRLVKGYARNVQGFHAWNEVYIEGQWLIVDASVDAQRRASGAAITMVKSSELYSATAIY